MLRVILLFSLLPLVVWGQNSEAYSNEDLRHYLEVSNALFSHRMERAAQAKNKQEELRISEAQMEQTLEALKEAGGWEALRPKLDPDFANRFDSLMVYRAQLKRDMRLFLREQIEPYNWDEDYYQHLLLTIQADPALQERLIQLSKDQQ